MKLPDNFVKGDCEHCPLCINEKNINSDAIENFKMCLIEKYLAIYGTKKHLQEDCSMKIIK